MSRSTWPRVSPSESSAPGAEALPPIRGKAILVVDDEPEISGVLAEMLSRELERRHPSLLQRFVFLTGDVLGAGPREFLAQTGAPSLSRGSFSAPCGLRERDERHVALA